jgi:hemerythrin superfamily protein
MGVWPARLVQALLDKKEHLDRLRGEATFLQLRVTGQEPLWDATGDLPRVVDAIREARQAAEDAPKPAHYKNDKNSHQHLDGHHGRTLSFC